MAVIYQNGVRLATSWQHLRLGMLGKRFRGINQVSYSVQQEKNNEYAEGNDPFERSRGNKNYESSLTLLRSAVQEIQDSLPPGASLLDIPPFDVFLFFRYENSATIVKHYLIGCEFTQHGFDVSQNDSQVTESMPLVVWNFASSEAAYNVIKSQQSGFLSDI